MSCVCSADLVTYKWLQHITECRVSMGWILLIVFGGRIQITMMHWSIRITIPVCLTIFSFISPFPSQSKSLIFSEIDKLMLFFCSNMLLAKGDRDWLTALKCNCRLAVSEPYSPMCSTFSKHTHSLGTHSSIPLSPPLHAESATYKRYAGRVTLGV